LHGQYSALSYCIRKRKKKEVRMIREIKIKPTTGPNLVLRSEQQRREQTEYRGQENNPWRSINVHTLVSDIPNPIPKYRRGSGLYQGKWVLMPGIVD
jgi:hypothetical protein